MICSRLKTLCAILIIGLISGSLNTAVGSTITDFGEVINTNLPYGKNSLCALRDRYGFLWVGTTTGLCCYDGNSRSVFSTWSGALENTEVLNITALYEHDDDIWFGGLSGLFVFDRKSNTVSKFPHKTRYGVPISSEVQKIMDDGNGRIWILTRGQGFFIFNESDKTLSQNSRNGVFYFDMAIGSDGRMYAVGMGGIINIFNSTGGFINSLHLPGYISDKNAMKVTAVGDDIWVAVHSNLYKFDINTQNISLEYIGTDHGDINAIVPGRDNVLLLGTDNGVWSYDAVAGTAIRHPADGDTNLRDNTVTYLCYDSDSSLIVVTHSCGISHMLWKPTDFVKVELSNNSKSNEQISVLRPSADGKGVWIGTETGLSYYDLDAKTLKRNLLPKKVSVTDIDIDSMRMCIATRNNGIIMCNPALDSIREYTYDENTPYAVLSNNVRRVYKTSRDEYFILTNWGLCKYLPGRDNFTTVGDIDNHIPFVAIQEDNAGRLWLATSGKNIYMRGHTDNYFSFYEGKEITFNVSDFFLGSNGVLWLVTQDNEIYFYDENESCFKKLNVVMSKDSPIQFLQDDLDGNLWIGASGTLAKVDLDNRLTYYSYPSISGESMSNATSCRLADGHIMFSCDNGFWIFDPNKMNSERHMANVYVHSIILPYAENNEDELRDLGLDILLYTRDEISLPYNDNTFTLMLSASRSSDMPVVRYDYMLEGVDKGWIRDAGPEVTYTNLSPGKYTFLLHPSFGSDLITRRLVINILPPWYKTWMAYCIYTLLALIAIAVIAILSRQRIRRHYHQRIEAIRVQKERETYESKMKFFVDLVHEIRTPLTLISLPLEQLSESVNDGTSTPGDNKKHIASMRRNVNYLLGIINQLLDFRKAEKDREVRLVTEPVNINTFLAEIGHRFEHPLDTVGKKLNLILPDEDIIATVDKSKLDRVIMNIVGNAIKYSRHDVVIELARRSKDEFSISVSDDGPGIPEKERQKIFDTYYQVESDNVAASLGTGLGLAYAKLIAKAHKGNIEVEGNDMGGATFVLSMPLDKTAENFIGHDVDMPDGNGPDKGVGEPSKEMNLMIIDDNVELLRTMSEVLSRKYNVVTAENASEAWDILEQRPDIDFIISDFMMPGMSGAELCKKVKSDVRFSHIPFIILTAKTNIEAKEEGMECGADVYIEKPFTIKQLTLQIANMMHMHELFYSRMSSGSIDIDTATSISEAPYINRVDTEFIETLNDYIRDNISEEEFSIDGLASQMNMSRSSFYRKLKAVTGMAPNDYLKNFRLDYACRLLVEGVRVTEAAERAGFTSSSYFAKCFKIRFGMSPKEYVSSKNG